MLKIPVEKYKIVKDFISNQFNNLDFTIELEQKSDELIWLYSVLKVIWKAN